MGPASTDPASGTAQVIANRGRVAYTLGGGRVRVINERLAEAASVTEAGCAWRGFGAGQLLWNCHAAAPGYPFGYSPLVALDGRQRFSGRRRSRWVDMASCRSGGALACAG